jgi:hypothetical protein
MTEFPTAGTRAARRLPIALLLLLAAAPPVRADEIRLDDGRVLVGKVTERGEQIEIATRAGTVVVLASKVVGRRRDAELRAALAETERAAPDTPFSHLQLASRALGFGLEREMWRHLDVAVALPRDPKCRDAQAANLRSRVDDFLAQLEPELLPRHAREGATKVRVHALLDQVRADNGPGRAAAIEELLVREQNADQDLRTEARRNGDPRRRVCALAALLRRAAQGNDRFVLRSAIVDGSESVRTAAVDLCRNAGHAMPEAVHYLAPGLLHQNALVRMRTADAFAALGEPAAVRALVLAGPNAGKALSAADQGVRGHVAFLQQQAYIRDFDVEVAQAAFIADPKIDVLQSGTVLDVSVVGVQEEIRIVHAYRRALQKLTSSDPGADPRAWAGWAAQLPAELAPKPDAPATTGGAPK